MNNLKQVVANLKAGAPDSGNPAKADSSLTRKPLTEKYADRVFMRMAAIYGHKWTSMYDTDESTQVGKAEWSDALAGLSDFQIAAGFKRCQRREGWPPTTGEFLRLATGLPSHDEAVARVIAHNVIDPVTRNIISAIGTWDMQRLTKTDLSFRARGLYQDAVEQALDEVIGMDQPWQPPVRIEQTPAEVELEKADPKVAEAALNAIHKSIDK